MKSHKLSFKSQIDPIALKGYKCNSEFEMDFWTPDISGDENLKGVMIMIHGFLEGSKAHSENSLSLSRYEFIAKELSRYNIAAILLPMPFHFSRANDFPKDEIAPLKRLIINGSFLHYGGYTQVKSDVAKLVDLIRNREIKEIRYHNNLKFHILGYSLGGAAAIGSAISSPKTFETISILFSAMQVENISIDALSDLGRKLGVVDGTIDWGKMKNDLLDILPCCEDEFRQIVSGNQRTFSIGNSVKRVLFVNGLKDDLFTTEIADSTHRFVLEDEHSEKCTIIKMPVDHFWTRHRAEVASYVGAFVGLGS